MRVITLNVNGIRSAARKGLFPWLVEQAPDMVCVQETRAQAIARTADHVLAGYQHFFVDAEKKGYSGVGIYTRHRPKQVIDRLGWLPADQEGRYLQLDFERLSVISVYFPSGTSGEHRQAVKYDFMAVFYQQLAKLHAAGRVCIICGDWNIAHQAIDLKNWRSNQKHSGFLPQERAWLTQVLTELSYVDGFRVVNQAPEQYTWWSNRGRAWDNNVGWRIDYQIVSSVLADRIEQASIYRQVRFSDHAPLIMDYAMAL